MGVNTTSFSSQTIVTLLLALACGGCTTYKTFDEDPGMALLIGHRCVLTKPCSFQDGRPHLWPTLGSEPVGYPMIELQSGTILRVSHVEAWFGAIDGWGSHLYAEIENGPLKGRSVVIGVPSHLDPSGGWVVGLREDEQGQGVVPYEPSDDGMFWAGVVKDGKRVPQMRNAP